jgi:hypothetical protein
MIKDCIYHSWGGLGRDGRHFKDNLRGPATVGVSVPLKECELEEGVFT